jgi:mannose-6-phosphate isomerase
MDGAGCLVGLSGSGAVRWGEVEVELKVAQAIVVPVGEVTIATDSGISFMRCVAPA